MAGSVVDGLKKLAKEGRTVICTIHQPSSQIYASFDRILLMAEGQNAFLGKTLDAKHFFTSSGHPCPENFNPSDHFIQVLAVVPGDEEKCRANVASICKKFEESEQGIEMAKLVEETEVMKDDSDKSDSRSPYKSSWGTQFKALMWRSWLSVIKEPLIVKMRIVQTVFMALILGFHGSNSGIYILWAKLGPGRYHEYEWSHLPFHHQYDLLQHVCCGQCLL